MFTAHENHLPLEKCLLYTSVLEPQTPRADNLTVIIMHGAGTADSSRHARFAEYFARHGVRAVSLDFPGHGKSSGEIQQSSLQYRLQCVTEAIQHYTTPDTPLILCGFSMSGHIVLRLLETFGARTRSIGLLCPATYAPEAENVSFRPDFTAIIRQEGSWKKSQGLKNAEQFRGKAAIVIGEEDAVIPPEVVQAMKRALEQNTKELRIDTLEDVQHLLAKWLSDNEAYTKGLVQWLIREPA